MKAIRLDLMAILSTAYEGTHEETALVIQVSVDGSWRPASADLADEEYGRDLLRKARALNTGLEYRLVKAHTVSTTTVTEIE